MKFVPLNKLKWTVVGNILPSNLLFHVELLIVCFVFLKARAIYWGEG